MRSRNGWSLALLIALVAGLGLWVAMTVGVQNVDWQRTAGLPADSPGTTRSLRYGLEWFFTILFYVFFVLTLMMALWRLASPTDQWANYLVIATAVVTLVLGIACVVIFALQWTECNRADNGNANLCNDLRYCCVFGSVEPDAPTSYCPHYLAPCNPAVTEDDLSTDGTFLLLFVCFIVGIVVAGLLLLFSYLMGRGKRQRMEYRDAGERLDDALGIDEDDLAEVETVDSRVRALPFTPVVQQLHRNKLV